MTVNDYHAEYPGKQVVHFSSYYQEENVANDFVVEQWNTQNRITHFLKARTAKNIQGTNHWILNDYYERWVGYPNDKLIENVTTLPKQ
jgi:lipopolysaccharide export LptBFGC system permease protein LptF